MTQGSEHDARQIEDWLIDRIATEVDTQPDSLPLDRSFFELGLNSLNTLVISGDLAEFLRMQQLEPSLFWDYPTISKLAEHLASLPAVQSA